MSSSRRASAVTILFSISLLFSQFALAAGKQSFTGEVGDAMCGKKHMDGTAAECTHTCVGQGSKYALIVGDKVYILNTSDKDALATLDKQAGKNVTVTGTVSGTDLAVASVVAAK